jgi:hypothetical protein
MVVSRLNKSYSYSDARRQVGEQIRAEAAVREQLDLTLLHYYDRVRALPRPAARASPGNARGRKGARVGGGGGGFRAGGAGPALRWCGRAGGA